jgi:ATP phosphoribosyltransferase-like protein
MEVQTCLITNQSALENPFQLAIIDEVRLLLSSVISGRKKRLIKCNVTPGVSINMILAILPAAQVPTRSNLADDRGFALESVVDESQVESLLPQLKAAGATAIVVAPIAQYVL